MMIVTYDEHGGFFDHTTPLNITAVAADQFFRTTGVRVPAFVISPHVGPGTVFHGPLDHTSILQMLADRFRPDKVYSKAVTDRQSHLVRLSTILPLRPPAEIRAPKIPKSILADMKKARAATPKKGKTVSHDETAEAFLGLGPSIAARIRDCSGCD
jgi:hypothetical protein